MAQSYSMDVSTKVFHFFVLVCNLGIVLAIMISAMTAKKDQTPFYLTNTFLSSYDFDGSLVSYTPYSEPRVPKQIKETYLNCLQEAKVAASGLYNCDAEKKEAYRSCLSNITSLDTRLTKMVTSVQLAIGEYGNNVSSIVQLPTQLTSLSKSSDLSAYLSNDENRRIVKLGLALQSSPVSVKILHALHNFETAHGPMACADALEVTLGAPGYDVGRVLTQAWQCTADYLVTEPIQQIAFEKCIPFEVWPTYDIMQTQYSLTIFGSYNKYFLLIVGAWLMASFGVYTMPGINSGTTSNGKPAFWLARAGKAFALFAFVWNLGAIIMVLVRGFTPGDSWENFPMSIQTVLVSGFFAVAASIYFGREVYELFIHGGDTHNGYTKISPASSAEEGSTQPAVVGQASRFSNGRTYQALNSFMRVDGPSATPLTEAQYTPLVAPAWFDVWFFVDAMLFLGVVGTSKDVVTTDLVIVVFCILLTTIMNSALIRLLYEGYINEVPDSSSLFKSYDIRTKSRLDVYNSKTSLYAVRVMAMVTSITSFLLTLVAFILVVTRYAFKLPSLYVLFVFFIPQLLMLVLNIAMDFLFITNAHTFYYLVSYMFSVHVLIRSIFLLVVWVAMSDDYKLTVDNSDSLNKLLEYINTDK